MHPLQHLSERPSEPTRRAAPHGAVSNGFLCGGPLRGPSGDGRPSSTASKMTSRGAVSKVTFPEKGPSQRTVSEGRIRRPLKQRPPKAPLVGGLAEKAQRLWMFGKGEFDETRWHLRRLGPCIPRWYRGACLQSHRRSPQGNRWSPPGNRWSPQGPTVATGKPTGTTGTDVHRRETDGRHRETDGRHRDRRSPPGNRRAPQGPTFTAGKPMVATGKPMVATGTDGHHRETDGRHRDRRSQGRCSWGPYNPWDPGTRALKQKGSGGLWVARGVVFSGNSLGQLLGATPRTHGSVP